MNKNSIIAFTAAVSALLLAGQAHALTLTNHDAVERHLQVAEAWADESAEAAQGISIGANQSLFDLCTEGCTIVLENGEQESFEGTEVVYIESGHFVTDENE